MPLKKIKLTPGVNRENTRYTNEGGWYESEKIRFRQGTPEKIGGWIRISTDTFLGLCRSLWNWVTLGGINLIGVGTNIKFYLEAGGIYNDITPFRDQVTLTNPFETFDGSPIVEVTDANGGYIDGDYVTFYGASAVGGLLLSGYSTAPATMTIATPCVVTATITFPNASPIVFTTSGALPTGLLAGTTYYTRNVSGLTFNLSLTPTGALINTSGSQSGIHQIVGVGGEYQITVTGATTYTITASSNATSNAVGGGTVYALYQINVGPAYVVPLVGWGAGPWGAGVWGVGEASTDAIRLWSQQNYGEDLIFGPREGAIYYWDATSGYTPITFSATVATPTVITASAEYANGTPLRFAPDAGSTLPVGILPGELYYVRNVSGSSFNISLTPSGALIQVTVAAVGTVRILSNGYKLADFGTATDVPTQQNYLLVSDISRFVFAFGCNDYASSTVDPMLIRWSDQEDPYNWTPASTNQAGFLRLSRGSEIVTATQSRQEILVWTDASLYSLQYVGAPVVWGAQLVGENISIVGQNAVAYANGVSYWMGKDKFYKYDGRTQTLNCDLRRYVFSDINSLQYEQVFAGTNEGFNEIWWFYCSTGLTDIDKYVVYNYAEDIWYYGNLARTAWLDSGLRNFPLAATYYNNIVNHEQGVDDNATATTLPIEASITSAEFDLDDGHNFMFVWRVLPDITFDGSTANSPSVVMYLLPLKNSGSGYSVNSATNSNHSVADSSFATITRTVALPVEEFTGQIFTRVRGRQMAIKIESTGLGVNWQLGAPRIDMRQDGRR
jgi:hypothetical protein